MYKKRYPHRQNDCHDVYQSQNLTGEETWLINIHFYPQKAARIIPNLTGLTAHRLLPNDHVCIYVQELCRIKFAKTNSLIYEKYLLREREDIH
jgi:hypothetical protein